jgi:hypothetical protein
VPVELVAILATDLEAALDRRGVELTGRVELFAEPAEPAEVFERAALGTDDESSSVVPMSMTPVTAPSASRR